MIAAGRPAVAEPHRGWWLAGALVVGAVAGTSLYSSYLSVLTANALSAWLAWSIAREHDPGARMRTAWSLVAAGSLANALRTAYEFGFDLAGMTDSARVPVLGLRQVAIAASLTLTAAGLAFLWWSFRSLRLGVRLRPLDWALMAAIVLLVPQVLWTRTFLRDANSPWVLVRALQLASPFLLALPAALSVVLYRISRESGEGWMAAALRCLALSFGLRLVALVLGTNPALFPGQGWLAGAAFAGAHWLFASGLVYRRSLSRAAVELTRQYDRAA